MKMIHVAQNNAQIVFPTEEKKNHENKKPENISIRPSHSS